MRRKLGREIALISLPLLIIGAAAWLLAGNGRALLPARFDNSPARLEFSAFESLEVAPMNVYQGYAWTGQIHFWKRGKFDVPASWTLFTSGFRKTGNYRLVYRQDTKWKEVEATSSEIVDAFSDGNSQTFSVNLKTVPANADEVHLRGKFEWVEMYSGVLPTGWNAPPNFARHGLRNIFTLPAQPFDVTIVAPGQPRPRPVASRETGIGVVKASYGVYDEIGVSAQLRQKPVSVSLGMARCGCSR